MKTKTEGLNVEKYSPSVSVRYCKGMKFYELIKVYFQYIICFVKPYIFSRVFIF
jgi:hypothetical protein